MIDWDQTFKVAGPPSATTGNSEPMENQNNPARKNRNASDAPREPVGDRPPRRPPQQPARLRVEAARPALATDLRHRPPRSPTVVRMPAARATRPAAAIRR